MSGPGASSTAGNLRALFAAMHFAAEQHRDHRRKGQTAAPYINHPIMVAEQLVAHGVDDIELLMAAVLHDVIEDTETTAGEVEARFGARVAAIVLEVSDDKSLDWDERKAVTVRDIARKSREARLLKLSDLIANVSDVLHQPPNWSQERKQRYVGWAEQVVGRMRGVHPGLEGRFDELLAEWRKLHGPLPAAGQ